MSLQHRTPPHLGCEQKRNGDRIKQNYDKIFNSYQIRYLDHVGRDLRRVWET